MENSYRQILKEKLNLELDDCTLEEFKKYTELFCEYNEHTNLMSKNDVKVLFEKHIFDSLALWLFLKENKIQNMLDIGTGGGFPSLPIAIAFKNISVVAMDSIQKKLKCIDNVKEKLDLKNIKTLCKRAENVENEEKNSFDIVTTRAVSALKNLFAYSVPYIKKNGFFVAFKSKSYQEELNDAKNIINKSNMKLVKIIDYNLPLDENFERKLLVIQKL